MTTSIAKISRLLLALTLVTASAARARARQNSPVFLQDSQRAAEALPRAIELSSNELNDEAARVLDELMRSDGDRLLASDRDPDILTSVRAHIHAALIARPALLDRYRALHEPIARAILEAGDPASVERDYLLTAAGFDAVLRVARAHLEQARFHTAWRALAQLDRHPDRALRRREAAQALSRIWTYIDGANTTDLLDPGSREMLDRWRQEAGLGAEALTPVTPPKVPAQRTLFGDAGDIRIDGVLPQPLISREMGPPAAIVLNNTGTTNRDLPTNGQILPSAPALSGDIIYTNTTDTVSAWNRFTGQQLWSTPIAAPVRTVMQFRRGRDEGLEELATVLPGDGVLVALTGAPGGGYIAERLLVGLEPKTGEVRWRVALSEMPSGELGGAVFKGPPVLIEGVVVIHAQEIDINRRTIVHHLAGFSADDGNLLWSRAITSIGATPYSVNRLPAEAITAFGPDAFFVSSLGAIVRLEAATGRVRWIRREAVEDLGPRISYEFAAWRFHRPVVTPEVMYTLSPDRRWLHRINPHSGESLARSNTRRWDEPHTLHLVGDTLVGVSDRRLVMCPASRIEDASELSSLATIPAPGDTMIHGRTVRAADRLYFPVVGGLVSVQIPQPTDAWLNDGTLPKVKFDTIQLDHSGNPLLLDGQVIVADDLRLHTYFAWGVARELLAAREAGSPQDPGAPITYAQLAYRAGETEEIGNALDRALGALASDPLRSDFSERRREIFDAVLSMARPNRDPSRLARLTPTMRRMLLDRLDALAVTPRERVASLMTAGAYFEAIGDAPRAVRRYQRLLADTALHRVPFEASGVRAPAAEEVARRLTTVVSAGGRACYAPYDAAAQARLDALGDEASLDDLLTIARAYPVAQCTPELYLRIGGARADDGEIRQAVDAYEMGLRALLPGEQPGLAGELTGRAAVDAARTGRLTAARVRIRDAAALVRGEALRYEGRELDTEKLIAQLDRLERADQRRPRISDNILHEPDILPGYRVQKPLVNDGVRVPTDLIVMRHHERDELSVWGVDGEGVLREQWGGLRGHDFLYTDGESIFTTTLDRDTPGRRVLHRFNAEDGRERWRSLAFQDIIDPSVIGSVPVQTDEKNAQDTAIPIDFAARTLIVSVTSRTLVLVERTGIAVGLDAETGRALWARRLPMSRVLDVDAASGVVAAIGLRRRTIDELRQARVEPGLIDERLAVLDVRTGELLHSPSLDREGQWVRIAPEGDVLVGTDGRLLRFTPRSGRLLASEDITDLQDAIGVEVFPGRAYVLSPLGQLLGITTSGERLDAVRVDTGGRIGTDQRLVSDSVLFSATRIGDRVYLASSYGFCAVDQNHMLVTADTRPSEMRTVVPVFSDRFAVSITTSGEATGTPGAQVYSLMVHELDTGRLADTPLRLPLPDRPDTIAILDGHVLVSSGYSTVILHAPPEKGVPREHEEAFDLESIYAASPTSIAPTPSAEPEIEPAPLDELE